LTLSRKLLNLTIIPASMSTVLHADDGIIVNNFSYDVKLKPFSLLHENICIKNCPVHPSNVWYISARAITVEPLV